MTPRHLILGLQHTVAMFGATVLVPLLTGLNPSVALFTAGVGTLVFHLVTGRMVPVFLGSSFAFIAPILAAKEAGFSLSAIGAGSRPRGSSTSSSPSSSSSSAPNGSARSSPPWSRAP